MEGNNHFLTREQILTVPDATHEDVYVKEWGGSVRVRSLTTKERSRLEYLMLDRKSNNSYAENVQLMRARMLALAIVDQEGRRIFNDADVTALNEKNPSAIEAVFKVAMKLSGLSREDVDELTKNSETSQSEGSFSD